jgi:hypothetical protein
MFSIGRHQRQREGSNHHDDQRCNRAGGDLAFSLSVYSRMKCRKGRADSRAVGGVYTMDGG